jgi:hypothetical protein
MVFKKQFAYILLANVRILNATTKCTLQIKESQKNRIGIRCGFIIENKKSTYGKNKKKPLLY